ncbi:acyltransferase [Thermodesulfobacteriota bacterium]
MPERIQYVDLIRAYAIIAVIIIHVSGSLVGSFPSIKFSWWWTGNFFNSFCRPCIPLFVMISGLLLLKPEHNDGIIFFFKKRIKRVLVPFCVWAIIYLLWISYVNERKISFVYFFSGIVQGPVYTHLWFIYMILGLYLATPILRVYIQNSSKTNQIYFAILWFTTVSIFPSIQNYSNLKIGIPIVVSTGFVGYYILGYMLSEIRFSKNLFILSLVIFIISWIVTCIGSYLISVKSGEGFNPALYDYLSPNIICMSMGLFLLIKFCTECYFFKFPFLLRIIRSLSEASFSIYLIHMIILETLKYGSAGITLSGETFHPLIGIPLTTFFVFSLCFTIYSIMRRVPLINYIFP